MLGTESLAAQRKLGARHQIGELEAEKQTKTSDYQTGDYQTRKSLLGPSVLVICVVTNRPSP